jgi:hypothetical protein
MSASYQCADDPTSVFRVHRIVRSASRGQGQGPAPLDAGAAAVSGVGKILDAGP